MQVGLVLISAALIGNWTTVTLGTELIVNIVTHGVSPEVWPCGQRICAISTRWTRKALNVVLYGKAFTGASVDTVGSYRAGLGD